MQIIQVLRHMHTNHRLFVKSWWNIDQQRVFVTTKVRQWADANGMKVSDAKVFAALTYFSHQNCA